MLNNALDILTAIAAIIAALLWFKSARIKTPNTFSIHVVKSRGQLGGNPMGGTYMGNAYSNDLQDLAAALKLQSTWSARAAVFAGISATLQSLSILIKALIPYRQTLLKPAQSPTPHYYTASTSRFFR